MKRNAKEDARLILELVQKGMEKKYILSKLGLNNSQFYYSLKSNCEKEELNEIKCRLKENSAKMVSASVKKTVVKPEIKLDVEKIVEEKLAVEKTLVVAAEKIALAITEEVETDYQEIGKDLKKGEYVFLDTSIIGIKDVEKILKNKKVICIFSTVVIEELDKKQRLSTREGDNARKLLRLAIEEQNIVLPIPKKTNLNGWRVENTDSFIVQTAFDVKEKYNPIVITSDKVLALKAKCQGLRFQYWPPSKSIEENFEKVIKANKKDIEIVKVREGNKHITIHTIERDGSLYILPKKGPHRYFIFDKGGNLVENDKGLPPYKTDHILFRVYDHCVQKIKLQNNKKQDNALLLSEGFFNLVQTDVRGINIENIAKKM